MSRQHGRVVKAVDSKSTGVPPRRFESCCCRYFGIRQNGVTHNHGNTQHAFVIHANRADEPQQLFLFVHLTLWMRLFFYSFILQETDELAMIIWIWRRHAFGPSKIAHLSFITTLLLLTCFFLLLPPAHQTNQNLPIIFAFHHGWHLAAAGVLSKSSF